ncbi:hypothetical protein ILYODFUR_006345 [Ilyodon furcidens]|uniref:Uncharacterized protein n=1 Tax=Ilyodon furcidens TaxID=33524 RepID=A0ABV0U3J8_9TELE
MKTTLQEELAAQAENVSLQDVMGTGCSAISASLQLKPLWKKWAIRRRCGRSRDERQRDVGECSEVAVYSSCQSHIPF